MNGHDTAGNVSQFVCYTPYGEAIVDEHLTTYENPFKFSGKELDAITGLYDHGARSRNPISTLWYGEDPLWEKFPEMSPYAYCHANPIRLIDPDGRNDNEANQKTGSEQRFNTQQNSFTDKINQKLSDFGNTLSKAASDLGNAVSETASDFENAVSDWYDNADIKGAAWATVGTAGSVVEVI